MILFRIALILFSIVLIVIGVAAMVAPTPFGFVLVLLGFFTLAAAAPGFVRNLRERWRWLDRRLSDIEEKSPGLLGAILRQTKPRKKNKCDENDEDDCERDTERQ